MSSCSRLKGQATLIFCCPLVLRVLESLVLQPFAKIGDLYVPSVTGWTDSLADVNNARDFSGPPEALCSCEKLQSN